MEDFQQSSFGHAAAACLPHYHDNIQIRTPGTCIDDDAHEAIIFDATSDDLPSKTPHAYGLLGTASYRPMVRHEQIAEDDSSAAVTQCWQKFISNGGDPAQIATSNWRASSLLKSCNSVLQQTRSHGCKKAAGGASRGCIVNGHVHKFVERERRNKMKRLCSSLMSLLPEEYHKAKHPLSDQLLESVNYIRHLQDKVIELRKKRDELNLLSTVKPFSNNSCVAKNGHVPEMFPTIRVSKFDSGIQVTANCFKNQIDVSSILMVLDEAGVEVVSATVSAINDRVFYSIHSKLSDFRQFDKAVLHGRIDQLMNERNLPSNSIIK